MISAQEFLANCAETGTSPNEKLYSSTAKTFLHLLVEKGKYLEVELIAGDDSIDLNVTDSRNRTPIDLAFHLAMHAPTVKSFKKFTSCFSALFFYMRQGQSPVQKKHYNKLFETLGEISDSFEDVGEQKFISLDKNVSTDLDYKIATPS